MSLRDTTRAAAVSEATAAAIERAVRSGADRDTVEIVAVEDVAVPYTDTAAIRLRVQAVGDLAVRQEELALD